MKPPPTPPAEAIERVPLDAIEPSPFNPRTRFDEADLAELVASIRDKGVLDPVVVRAHPRRPVLDDKGRALPPAYELIGGERRTRAARAAGLAAVPARVVTWTDAEVRDYQLLEFDQRKDLSASERAAAYQREVDAGRSVDDVARAVGKSPWAVRQALRLLKLSAEARGLVDSGWLPRRTAELVGGVHGEQARRAAERCVLSGTMDPEFVPPKGRPRAEEPLSYRDARRLIREHFTTDLRQAPFALADRQLVPAAGACDACPKRAGNAKREDPELADAPDHMCLDPECFRAKCDALRRREEARAKSGGRPVLPKAEGRQLFDRFGVLKAGSPYVDLASTGEGTKSRTYAEAVGPAVAGDVVIAFDPAGGRHELVPRAAAEKALKERGGKGAAAPSANGHAPKTGGGGSGPADWKRESEERDRVGQAVSAELARSAQSMFAALLPGGDGAAAQVLRPVAAWAADVAGGLADGWDGLFKRRGIAAGRGPLDERKGLLAYLGGLDAAGVVGFLVDVVAIDATYTQEGQALAKALHVDRKAIEKRVRDELKAEAQAPANGKHEANGTGKAGGPKRRPIAGTGLTPEDLHMHSACAKWGGGRPPAQPVSVKAFLLDAEPYVLMGGMFGPDRDEWEFERLYPAPVFKATYPAERTRLTPRDLDPLKATDADRDNSYFGTRVRVGKQEFVIGPPRDRRTLFLDKPKKKAKARAGR